MLRARSGAMVPSGLVGIVPGVFHSSSCAHCAGSRYQGICARPRHFAAAPSLCIFRNTEHQFRDESLGNSPSGRCRRHRNGGEPCIRTLARAQVPELDETGRIGPLFLLRQCQIKYYGEQEDYCDTVFRKYCAHDVRKDSEHLGRRCESQTHTEGEADYHHVAV